jgi:hypothetical protein
MATKTRIVRIGNRGDPDPEALLDEANLPDDIEHLGRPPARSRVEGTAADVSANVKTAHDPDR